MSRIKINKFDYSILKKIKLEQNEEYKKIVERADKRIEAEQRKQLDAVINASFFYVGSPKVRTLK